ncbi:conjugal transfer protein MobB [Chryseobacterium lathyri]|uniref:Mobilization protein n=1 Tax=Chryseobacterium lathyri TaxID=395933 RepID=A0A511Y7R8_9FLAO|nr:conjugal transfer protein MobB [Chryseobacterium lathyri]GEN71237.1 mobilization protein [Chryseobacterium lathyri]
MIAKIGKGANLYGVINYNFQKVASENGQILGLNNMPESLNGTYSVSYLMKCFDPYLTANHKTEKTIRHISLNPDASDYLNDEKLVAIANEYMTKMEFEKQPYIIFKHTDIERTHIHIVTTCVRSDGRKIPDYNDHKRSMAICRNIEKDYGLLPAMEKATSDDLHFRPVDYKKGNIKSQISSIIRYLPWHYKFQTLGSYNALLSLFNIRAEEVKGEINGQMKTGLVYFALDDAGNKISNPFKASLFGKKSGTEFLNNHFQESKRAMKSTSVKSILKNTCESILAITNGEAEFKKQLAQQGINIVVRRNEEGRVYGITFIDHESRTVWNGSQLGKELSANVFNLHWKDDFESSTDKSSSYSFFRNENTESTNPNNILHQLFDFLDEGVVENLTESFVDGLGSLVPGAQGDDYEEMAFANRMKKKKKIRRTKF